MLLSLPAAKAVSAHYPGGGSAVPLLFDSPHSGRYYPADFIASCSRDQLRSNEDFHVDELLALLPDIGATVIAANYPRTYMDVNRALTDLDVSLLYEPWPWLTKPSPYTQAGIGLIHREVRPGLPIYRDRISVAMVQSRIRVAYMPYHEALAQMRANLLGRFGTMLMVSVHSMPAASAPKDAAGCRYDVVLGDRDGLSSAPEHTNFLAQLLTKAGLSVAINKSFKGGEIVRRYGLPAENTHAIQLEFNRALYMDEFSLSLNTAGVVRLQKVLRDAAAHMATAIMQPPEAMAAE